MRLTFEHDLEIMLKLAASIADSVARASGRFDLREDAESDALVELLEIEFDPENPGWQAYLKKRVGGVLFRRLQNESGSRLKEPPKFVSIVEDVAAPEPEEEEPEAMSAADAVNKALGLFSSRDQTLLLDWQAGIKQTELAKKLRLSNGRISQIVSAFKALARFYRDHGGGVVIVDTKKEEVTEEEKKKWPLLYVQEKR